jgi:hypothetical protein
VARLSPLHTGCLYTPGNISGTGLSWRLSQPQGRSAVGRIISVQILVTLSGIDLVNLRLVTVSQPIVLACAPVVWLVGLVG